MYRTIGKMLAVLVVIIVTIMVILFVATGKKGDDGTVNSGITTKSP